MSTKYKTSEEVPDDVLCARLEELAESVTKSENNSDINREFYMRIPAEVDHDADLVLCEAALRIARLRKVCDASFGQVKEKSEAIIHFRQQNEELSKLLLKKQLEIDKLNESK